jgi:hypothetical protein
MSYVCISLLTSHNYHRWYGLQIAREGDVYAVQRFLNRVPDYSDMDNMFRAAVRFRVSCYAVVQRYYYYLYLVCSSCCSSHIIATAAAV